jgi:hypothetical protein
MEMKNLQENQTYFFKVFCGKPSSEKDFSLFLSNPFRTLKTEVPTSILNTAQIQRGIWVLGGIGSSGESIAEVDFYDPIEKKWYPNLTNIPTPRKFAGIASNNRKIYVMGGMIGNTTVSLVEELSITESSLTWKTMNPMPANLQGFLADSTGNEIYLLGGSTTNNMQLGTLLPFTIYRFQPRIGDLGVWATITTPQALYQNIDMAGCILDGTFFLGAGRYFNDGSPQNFVNGYVIGSNTTTTLSEANTTYFHHGSASVCYKPLPDDPFPRDTKALFIIGGSTQSNLAQPATAITARVDMVIKR